MTVKTLTPDQKEQICYWFSNNQYNQKQLAQQYGTSERTIARVLAEAGVHSAPPRMTKETAQVMQLLKAHGMSLQDLEACINTRAPGGVAIDHTGRAYGDVSDEQIEYVLEGALTDVRKRSGLTLETVDPTTEQPWRVSEQYSHLYGTKSLKLSVGIEEIKADARLHGFVRWVAGSNISSKPVTKEQMVEFAMNLPEEVFALLHSQIITARVAKASNTHVQTSMLNLQNKVEANAKATEELRSKPKST